MQIHPQSHTDHVPPAVLSYLLHRFAARCVFFIETFDLPPGLPDLDCRLYGPAVGDDPVPEAEVEYRRRGDRTHASRTVDRPPRPTRVCTVVAGPFAGDPCVLYTAYGGPRAPREPDDPLSPLSPDDERERAAKFWSEHALARG